MSIIFLPVPMKIDERPMTTQQRIGAAMILVAVFLLFSRGQGCSLPGIGKPTAATYFYDDKQTGIPVPVKNAIANLNAAGIMATNHEVDTTDASGDVPEQYKVSLPAAKEVGLPALVVMGGQRVLRVLKVTETTTEQDIMEAVQ